MGDKAMNVTSTVLFGPRLSEGAILSYEQKIENQMLKLTRPIEAIASKILFIRGHKVTRRNSNRFPDDFMFQLTIEEKREVVANCDHLKNLKFSKALPLAFTEHGAIQAANVLNSEQAAEIGVYVVRAFVRLRELLASNKDMAKKLEELERKLQSHDQAITGLIKTLRQMMEPAHTKRPPIGFLHPKDK